MDAKLYAKVAKGNLLIFYSVYLTDFFAFIAVLPLRPLRLKNPGEFLVSWCLGGRKRLIRFIFYQAQVYANNSLMSFLSSFLRMLSSVWMMSPAIFFFLF
jgi:hypothetical protein